MLLTYDINTQILKNEKKRIQVVADLIVLIQTYGIEELTRNSFSLETHYFIILVSYFDVLNLLKDSAEEII